MAGSKRPTVQVVLGAILGGIGAPPLSGCNIGWASCPPEPAGYRPPYSEWTVEVSAEELIERGAESGPLGGLPCEQLCGQGRHFYDNSCILEVDPDLLDRDNAGGGGPSKIEEPFPLVGGAGGEGGLASFGGNGGQSLAGAAAGGGAPLVPVEVPVMVSCSGVAEYPCEGRRHASWGPGETSDCRSVLGAWFGRAARNEASSVRSFRALTAELRGTAIAPRFLGRLRKAARDEVRHARLMEREAIRYGGRRPRRDFLQVDASRSLEDIAKENAREGCVFEMYAALEMCVLASRAELPEHRRLFAAIADDEMEHAQLAWDLHEAFLSLLSLEARRRTEEALEGALCALRGSVQGSSSPELQRALGLPHAATSAVLRAQLALAARELSRSQSVGASGLS